MTKATPTRGRKPLPKQDDKQQQADAPKATTKRAPKQTETAKAGSGRGRRKDSQQQMGGLEAAREHLSGKQQQGADTSGKAAGEGSTSDGVIRGGTKQVLIEEATMDRSIGRPPAPEEYPFTELPVARKNGIEVSGPSFFIPDSDKPKTKIAAARKRHAPTVFWTRKMAGQVNGKGPMVPGVRVWKAPAGTVA